MATPGITFNPATDIPSLEGKVILITGTNCGLGKQAALELARHKPAMIWMTARNAEKGQEAADDVVRQVPGAAVTFVQLDLASFESIKKAVKTVLAKSSRLDVLMLNAGLMGAAPALTAEGYEIHMGTNHIGHALLLRLLTPLLLETAAAHPDTRVVTVASAAFKHVGPEKIQFDTLKSLEGVKPVPRYLQSKTANLLYTQGLAQKYPALVFVSVDPGEVETQLFKREPADEQMRWVQTEVAPKLWKPVEEGVKNQLWAATAPVASLVSGRHYEPVGKYEPVGLMLDAELAKDVWNWTEKELEGQQL
ncbi:NAD(P)-binding protein [Cryphonectria parasitica EP155]|uniref:NAD(P)-binding protein n=1 Tax=Cryphonectria parasitica (strain ATCC 38755 / EP155) TaxID=660469 RepID=A0A9P4XVI1_CRYP1|nr:NAD(P)-binding protein [Cryphonectria parasitica EP155]KAF3761758.1 NAD(P)-binding protein [Cryphonectria parasitica EP155]